jgi:hypothetical protein
MKMTGFNEQAVLGETSGALHLDNPDTLVAVTTALAEQGKNRLLIYSHSLRHLIYDHTSFIESVKNLAIRSNRSVVRILLVDAASIKAQGHRLVYLAQRLPSTIEIRIRPLEEESDLRSFMLVDDAGYVMRGRWHDIHASEADFCDRPKVRNLAREFGNIWEHSAIDSSLRQLSI